jgi:hypothetical protein
MSEGEIVNPGDLHGRVLQASEIELAWDGNLVSALIGEDLVVGVSGLASTVPDALRELADNLIREAVWVELPNQETIDISRIRELENTTITRLSKVWNLQRQNRLYSRPLALSNHSIPETTTACSRPIVRRAKTARAVAQQPLAVCGERSVWSTILLASKTLRL